MASVTPTPTSTPSGGSGSTTTGGVSPTPNPSPGPSPTPPNSPISYSGVNTSTLEGIAAASGTSDASPNGVSTSGGGTYQTGGRWVHVTPEQAQKSGKFNPPPHPVSRSIPPIAFPEGTGRNTQSIAELIAGTRLKRGYMYQDADAKIGVARAKDMWGFNFMYNPTSIGYTNAQIDGIDWTNPANTQANLLVGNMNVQVSLYLNRVFDMSAIREGTASKNYGYPRPVSATDLLGIKTRGTEWDLEYLYRVLNGDPVKNPTMANGIPTADWGFIAGVPIWIRFHANMRYKVSVNSISVNHVMFTREMVPILSEIQLTLTRIPVIGYNEQTDLAVLNSYDGRTTGPRGEDQDSTGDAGAGTGGGGGGGGGW